MGISNVQSGGVQQPSFADQREETKKKNEAERQKQVQDNASKGRTAASGLKTLGKVVPGEYGDAIGYVGDGTEVATNAYELGNAPKDKQDEAAVKFAINTVDTVNSDVKSYKASHAAQGTLSSADDVDGKLA